MPGGARLTNGNWVIPNKLGNELGNKPKNWQCKYCGCLGKKFQQSVTLTVPMSKGALIRAAGWNWLGAV
jgi:hypothetical protein